MIRDNPGRPVPEETFTHSHPSGSSCFLYHLEFKNSFKKLRHQHIAMKVSTKVIKTGLLCCQLIFPPASPNLVFSDVRDENNRILLHISLLTATLRNRFRLVLRFIRSAVWSFALRSLHFQTTDPAVRAAINNHARLRIHGGHVTSWLEASHVSRRARSSNYRQ